MAPKSAIKFVQKPTQAVEHALRAYCTLHHDTVVRISGTGVIALKDIDPTKVAIVCGGGSGHEPAHIGFVAKGWLSASVCGNLFASPPITDVSAAIRYIDGEQRKKTVSPPGILVVVKNYTGDVMNFGYAVREAAAQGISIDMLVVGDDVAFGVDHDARRGIAGTVLLYELLGAAATKDGATVEELVVLGQSCMRHLCSFGASLSSCTVPGSEKNCDVENGMVELGLGIHGERGLSVVPFENLATLVHSVLDILLADPAAQPRGERDDAVVLLLNNLGSTTDVEMHVTLHHTLLELNARGVRTVLAATGRYMTALDMHGVSWTMLRLPNKSNPLLSERILNLLMSDVRTIINFKVPEHTQALVEVPGDPPIEAMVSALNLRLGNPTPTPGGIAAGKRLLHVCTELASQGAAFNAMDAKVGDGDTGFGVVRACKGVETVVTQLPWGADVPGSLRLVAKVVADAFAGSTGPLYGAFLVAASNGLPLRFEDVGNEADMCSLLRGSFINGATAVKELGRAQPGERTMVDAMEAVVNDADVRSATTVAALLDAACKAAKAGAAAAKDMRATKGRSRYLGGKEIGHEDPGCELVVAWLELARGAMSIV